jgi:lysozyme
MVYIDPKVAAELPTTQDMWMARAFGLDSDSPTSAQYENMERIQKNLAEKLGWKPHQVQAAVWVAMKGRFDPVKASITKHAKSKGWLDSSGEVLPKYEKKYSKYFNEQVFGKEFDEEQMLKAAYDYANGIEDNLGNIALEAIPSVTSGVLRGIHTAAPEAQAAFTKDMYEIFLEDGVDQLAKEIGILAPDNFTGFGGWQGTVNESIQLRAVMSGTDTAGINVADQELMDMYASVVGTVFKQDGVSYRRAFTARNWNEKNGVTVRLEEGRLLTRDETERLYKSLEEVFGDSWTSPIPSHKGVELINYTDDIDNKTFMDMVESAIIQADLPTTKIGSFRSEGKLLENNWEVYPNGQGYQGRFEGQRSDLYNRLVAEYSEKAEKIRQKYAKEYGWNAAEGSTNSSKVGVPAAAVVGTSQGEDSEDFIKSFEKYKGVGYYATKSEQLEGLVTAGYGSTKRVKIGEKISKEQAEQWFKEDLTVAEKAVDKLVKVDLNNNQRVAIVSLIFNIGEGNFKKSKALKALNKGDFDMFIEEAFDSKKGFVKSGNRILKGLVKRRQAEKKLFQGVSG